jgi:hypothetical protein
LKGPGLQEGYAMTNIIGARPTVATDHSSFLPEELGDLTDMQKAIPRIAKDGRLTALIDQSLPHLPSKHDLYSGDARDMAAVQPESVQLVLTSPPYWTLKQYTKTSGQLGHVEDYEQFLGELDKVWRRCFAALVPG